MLPLFPTPYPDEILYSVLCRYHARCGSPSARRTNIEIWGNGYGKKLLLPDNIERIAAQIPNSVGFTAGRLINETTIYPLLQRFVSRDSAEFLFEAMRYGNPNVYNIVGFSHIQTFGQRYLRYCGQCFHEDTEMFGEPYWHRLHQFPGVFVCHKHGVAMNESNIGLASVRDEYYPLSFVSEGTQLKFAPDVMENLVAITRDFDWLLQNANAVDCYESTLGHYDKWLRVRGFRDHNGKMAHKKLAEALVCYYGQELLSIFDAYNSGACSWTRKIAIHGESLRHPIIHILLMRFLAGSTEDFFSKAAALAIPKYLPFGEPPYPCRNSVCDYYLQDVIQRIDVISIHATPRATFACPYCGFTYRRKGNVPKEKQYCGQIDIVDYGWVWREKVTDLLNSGISPYKIAHSFRCDVRTILDFGVEHRLLLPGSLIRRPQYVPAEKPHEKPGFEARRNMCRKRRLAAIAANPGISRNELRMLDSATDQWLHMHDAEWYEENSPSSRKFQPKWGSSANQGKKYL